MATALTALIVPACEPVNANVQTSSRANTKSASVASLSGLGGAGTFAPFVTTEADLKRLELDDRIL